MLAVLAADLFTTVLVSDRTEARVRTVQDSVFADLVTSPTAELRSRNRRWVFGLRWAPIFTLRDFPSPRPEMLNVGTAEAEWHQRNVRLVVTENASIGLYSFSYLLPQATPTDQPAPAPQVLPATASSFEYGSWNSTLRSVLRLGRRWSAATWLSYRIDGGLDEPSRTILPLLRGPLASASIRWRFARRDEAITTVSGSIAELSSGRAIEMVSAQEGWLHRLAPHVDVTLSAGGAFAHSRQTASSAWHDRPYPTVEAVLAKRLPLDHPNGVTWTGVVRLAPVVDRLTGLVDQRAQAMGAGAFVSGPWAFEASAGFTQSVSITDAGAVTFVMAGAEITRRIGKRFFVSGGVRFAWQTQAPFGSFASTTQFVALTYRHPSLTW